MKKLASFKLIYVLAGFSVFYSFFFSATRIEIIKNTGIIYWNSVVCNTMKDYFYQLRINLFQLLFLGFQTSSAWLFGMEYAGKTARHLMTLPFARATVIFSKTIALLFFSALFMVFHFTINCVFGILAPFPEEAWSWKYAADVFRQYLFITGTTSLTMPFIFFLALWSRGFIFPVGVIIFLAAVASWVKAFLEYYILVIPYYYVLTGTMPHGSVTKLICLCAVFMTASVLYWRYADHNK
jgi:ABC-type transport system involved in multi-copper enzyme maturation permease subunit